MGWESFGVVGFDLGPLLEGQTRIAKLKSAFNSLIIGLRGNNANPTHTKSWTRNLLMLDLTFGPSFKVNDGSLALVSCRSGGYKFALVLRCVSLVLYYVEVEKECSYV